MPNNTETFRISNIIFSNKSFSILECTKFHFLSNLFLTIEVKSSNVNCNYCCTLSYLQFFCDKQKMRCR